jgi:hypothetical protein
MSQTRAPVVITITVLLLLVMYVGSYLALVKPPGKPGLLGRWDYYRAGEPITIYVYYPLELIDRRVRPQKWVLPRKE